MASTSFAYGSRGDAAPFNPAGPRRTNYPAVLLYDGSRRGRVRSYRTRGNRRTRQSTVGRASDDRTDALDGDSGARGSSVSVDTLDATGRGANDEDGQKKNDGWWSWTTRWAVGDSDEDEDEDEEEGAAAGDDALAGELAQRRRAQTEGGARNVKQRSSIVWGADGGASRYRRTQL